MPNQLKYHQNGGMFFLVRDDEDDEDGEYKHIQEYEDSNIEKMYELFEKLIKSATSIIILSEFSLYGFVFEIRIPRDGPVKIMSQTRNASGEQLTPRTASNREDSQFEQFEQLPSICLKVVGLIDDENPHAVRSKPYVSLDPSKTKNKFLATLDECREEVAVTRRVWNEMTRYNCAEVVPDAGFGFDVSYDEFERLFMKFIIQPTTKTLISSQTSSHAIQWIIRNFDTCYLTVTEIAFGCYTFSEHIDMIKRRLSSDIAKSSIKNASMEIVAYFIATWIRTGIMTTDGHTKNVMITNTDADEDGIHTSFIVNLLDLGRIIDLKKSAPEIIEFIKYHFRRIFTNSTPNRIALRPALLSYLGTPLPGEIDAAFIENLTINFMAELDFVASLEQLSLTGLKNIDQLKRAFRAAVACDIIVNASNYDHEYMQCVTILERAFGRKFTNVSFLSDPFDTQDDVVFTRILSTVNRLLIPCHLGEDLPSLRMMPQRPLTPRVTVKPRRVEKVAVVIGAAAEVPDDSSSSDDLIPGQRQEKGLGVGGSRKSRRHKNRRGIKRSRSHLRHLRRSRTKKRRIRTTRRKYDKTY